MNYSDIDLKLISIDMIYYYLNDSKYSKEYILKNFNSAITILSKNLKDYFAINSNVKSMQQGQRQITYNNKNMNDLMKDIKPMLPVPRPRGGVIYV